MKHFRYILLFKGLFEINLTISIFAFTNSSVTVVAVVVDIWQPASNLLASQITFSYFINADRLPDYIAIYLSQAARMQHISLQSRLLHCYIK